MTGLFLLALLTPATSFYLPGVYPTSFETGDPVSLQVDSLRSRKTLPLSPYSLPFCAPENKVKVAENLGEFLTGESKYESLYKLKMREEVYCAQLCTTDLGREGRSKFYGAVKEAYHNNWIVDNLPASMEIETEKEIVDKYFDGFPIGYMDNDNNAFVYNHANIQIEYHEVESEQNKYRIVGFQVEPFSINHQFDLKEAGWNKDKEFDEITIVNPMLSCAPTPDNEQEDKMHTNYDMVQTANTNADGVKSEQKASGIVLFTYDVTWVPNPDLHWASRWDIYLSMGGTLDDEVHWLSILNSVLIVLVLSAMIACILVRALRKDLMRYNAIPTDEEKAEEREEFGWKLVHADVFRPPSKQPMLLAVCCGTGAQLLCMSVFTIFFAAIGFLSPAYRGGLVMGLLMFYVLMGGVAGFVTARFYKTFKGKMWQRATLLTAFLYPGGFFAMFFLLDLASWIYGSSDAVPFWIMLVVVLLWFCVSTPLVFLGSYFGYKKDAIEFPVNTSNIPRQIPEQPWFMNFGFTCFIGGVLPFGACFVELFFILSTLWTGFYYYMFGFLFIVFSILVITCAEITLLFCYFQLCAENYHWWWRSFMTGASTGLWIFLYSAYYFQGLGINTFATYLLYFGYMSAISIGVGLITGFVGLMSCLWFNKKIYGSIKVD